MPGQQVSLPPALMEGCALLAFRLLKANTPTSSGSDPTVRYTVAAAIRPTCQASCPRKEKILWTFLLISHVILGSGGTFLHLARTLCKPPSCRTKTVTFYKALTARHGKHMMGPLNTNTHTCKCSDRL